VGVHVGFAAAPDAVEAALIAVLGLAFAAFASSYWAALAIFVPHAALGIAFGFVGSLQNTGLAIAPYAVALMQPPACGAAYTCVDLFFASSAALAACLGTCLLVMQLRARARRHSSAAGRRAAAPAAAPEDALAGTPFTPLLA
jgi:hypothetical protein